MGSGTARAPLGHGLVDQSPYHPARVGLDLGVGEPAAYDAPVSLTVRASADGSGGCRGHTRERHRAGTSRPRTAALSRQTGIRSNP